MCKWVNNNWGVYQVYDNFSFCVFIPSNDKAVKTGYIYVVYFECSMFCEFGGFHSRVIEDCDPRRVELSIIFVVEI